MTTKKDKKDEIKPLSMTTDEAINFLFPKEVVDELKEVANQPKKNVKHNENALENGNGDSLYLNNTK